MNDDGSRMFLIGGRGASGQNASVDAMGFKAYNLWRMDRFGLHVPQAFVLGTGYCREFFRSGCKAPANLRELLVAGVREVEQASGLAFGSARRPLLVSVRSGAPVSMPGMMETVLNIGMCDAVVPGLLRLTGNPRLVWDSYRRLIQAFAEIVHAAPAAPFDAALAARMREAQAASVRELDFRALRAIAREHLALFEELTGRPFPQAPLEQLEAAVAAVWSSWSGAKVVEYRRLRGIPDDGGTAVTVQRMVYGNAGGTSGSGVAFTRDPASGERTLYLDFMFNAQGEDIVSGRRSAPDGQRLAARLPDIHEEILKVAERLEKEFRDMQEFEFTVQDGRLYVLQTRGGKRTPWAALAIAVDQIGEGLCSPDEALARLDGLDLATIERARIVADGATRPVCRAQSASLGVAVGEIALDSARAQQVAGAGRPAILVRTTTSTEDIAGIAAATGILTATGGRTSHAAVVARQLDKVCLVGCEALSVDLARRRCALAGEWLSEGDVLSLDGQTGDVYAGRVEVTLEKPVAWLEAIAGWRAQALLRG
jgi:pyruvate,orthophosphate dikinase